MRAHSFQVANQTENGSITSAIATMSRILDFIFLGSRARAASEARQIIQFFGEESAQGIDWYGFKLVLEDGRMYSFGLKFSWIPPLVG